MKIEILKADGTVFTTIDGVIDAQQEFNDHYQPMYGKYAAASWREYTPPLPTPEQLNTPILAQIVELEAKQARPLREYALATTEVDKAEALQRVRDLDDQIVALREQLAK